jgi:uncharacterized surface protein with fasciclin (FAS1) repeats
MVKRFALCALLTLALVTVHASAQTVADLAVATPELSTLVTALGQAGLVEVLQGEGPFTVFAPTNGAFAALPAAQLNALLADPAALVEVLTYHVVPGNLTAAALGFGRTVRTVQGGSLAIASGDAGLTIGGAVVLRADIPASNGIVHIIDRVLLPDSDTVRIALAGNVRTITYRLDEVAGSGVRGTVTLDALGGQTLVTVVLRGTPAGGDHPSHFHSGNCGSGGGIVIPLENVNGTSGIGSTLVDAPLATIIGRNHHLNVHLSPTELATVVACGEIGVGATPLP